MEDLRFTRAQRCMFLERAHQFSLLWCGQVRTVMDSSSSTRTLWRNLDYLLLLVGQSISALGTGISQVALPLLVLMLTNDPILAGLVSSLGQFSSFLLLLIAGSLVDRWNRKRIMILCAAAQAVCSASVVLIWLYKAPLLAQVILFCLCSLLIGALNTFSGLARLSALTQVVLPSQLSQAVALDEIIFGLATLMAPLGTLLLNLNPIFPFVTDAISYAILLVFVCFIRTSLHASQEEKRPHLFKDVYEGLKWVWQRPVIRFLVSLAGYLEVIVSVNVVLVAVIARNERFPLNTVGIILGAAGVGDLLGAALSPLLQRRFSVGWLLISTLLLFLLLWPLYAWVTNPWALGIIVASLALIDSITYIQTAVYPLIVASPVFQGRVNSIARLTAMAGLSLGPIGVGVGLRYLGIPLTMGILWIGFIPFACLALFHPQLRRASLPKNKVVLQSYESEHSD
ncbi:MAG TPA: MFS transporter [Ktedonobacteraceae bacterium]